MFRTALSFRPVLKRFIVQTSQKGQCFELLRDNTTYQLICCGMAEPSKVRLYAQATHEGSLQADLDVQGLRETAKRIKALPHDEMDGGEIAELINRLEVLSQSVLSLEQYDEETAALLGQFRSITLLSGKLLVDTKDRVSKLEKLIGELTNYSVSGDWVRSFHELVATLLGLATVENFVRVFRAEEKHAKDEHFDKWLKGKHQELKLFLIDNNISMTDWENSLRYRQSRNSTFHARNLTRMSDWEGQLNVDLSVLETEVPDPSERQMLKKVLTAFGANYLRI